VVTHYDLDATLAQIIDHVFAHATNALERGAAAVADDSGLLERAVEVIDQQRTERSDRSEIVP
jgi:hypothetical protein